MWKGDFSTYKFPEAIYILYLTQSPEKPSEEFLFLEEKEAPKIIY